MEQQDNLAAAIDYFHGQAEISEFAAEVEGYLLELQQARQKLKLFESSAKINADAWAHQANLASGFGSDNGMSELMRSDRQ